MSHLTLHQRVQSSVTCWRTFKHELSARGRLMRCVLSCTAGGVDVDSLALAPALLPRGWLQHQALLALQQVHQAFRPQAGGSLHCVPCVDVMLPQLAAADDTVAQQAEKQSPC
jgi:hypothetical protein